MDNNPFNDLKDPYDRLEEMEQGLLDHARHITSLLEQTRSQSELLEAIGNNMQELAKMNLYLYKRSEFFKNKIIQLEIQNASKK